MVGERMSLNYFKEQRVYTFNEIKLKLGIGNNEEARIIINLLKNSGVVKVRRFNTIDIDLNDIEDDTEDIIIEDSYVDGIGYVFKFVGIISVKGNVLICYPKYIKSTQTPENEMKQVLKVIKKYNSKEQIINLYNGDDGEKNFNLLAILLYLYNDYYINGIYSNNQEIIEINGEGEIIWDKTINETVAFINNNRPVYLDIYTKHIVEDDNDYFTRLHKFILTECSQRLINLNLATLLDIEDVFLYDGELEEFGDIDYILYKIEKELRVQFITYKQIILKTLYAYISNRRSNNFDLGISFYGTNSFNLVWEKVCCSILDNKLNYKISLLPKKLSEKYIGMKEKTLFELLEKPKWTRYRKTGVNDTFEASKTLIPDLIGIFKDGEEYGFWMFDAKYYNIDFKKNNVKNNPGVEDVTKQYLYQLAYRDFIKSNGYIFKENIFLFPSDKEEILNIGQASMGILAGIGDGLRDIELVKLPAKNAYDLYLKEEVLDIGLLSGVIIKKRETMNQYKIDIMNKDICDIVSQFSYKDLKEERVVGVLKEDSGNQRILSEIKDVTNQIFNLLYSTNIDNVDLEKTMISILKSKNELNSILSEDGIISLVTWMLKKYLYEM